MRTISHRQKSTLFIYFIAIFALCSSNLYADSSTSAKGASYRIRVGDIIHINMKEDEDVKYEGEVSTNGFVIIPYYGAIKIQNLTENEAAKHIKTSLEKDLYRQATVSVVVLKRVTGFVYVYGAVEEPGKVEIPADGYLTLLQTLAEVKGMSRWAAPKLAYAMVRKGKSLQYERVALNLTDAYKNINGTNNLKLKADDMLLIPSLADASITPGAVEVMVAGKVNKPGVVVFEPGEPPSVIRALLKAGNLTKFADKSGVRIIRKISGKTEIIKVNVEKLFKEGALANDITLLSGDLIIADASWF